MYLVINNNKIKINKAIKFIDRLKGLMFMFEPIKEGLLFEKCRSIHTYFMCQSIDVIMTDKNNKIIKLYPKLKSERIIWPKRKVYYTYELPLNSIDNLKVGDILVIEKKNN
ncbi:MAG: hypothetical protein GX861_03505 [Tenericutes bacterium]|jgi:uncharacterized membrane protein (UPF0127 family)|nr:hypothetical protein [Mycoplasmatota bacterium]